jgi:FAD/FMN-containing dehydrogenase
MYMPLVHTPAELAAMAGVKAAFDPRGLLNPGKVLPDGVCPPVAIKRAAEVDGFGGAEERADRIQEAFIELLGPGKVEATLIEGRGDGGVGGRPRTWLQPREEGEVAACLRLASERGWAVLPAGAGTWLHGGQPLGALDAVLSVAHLDGVVEYEPADLTLTAGAGLTLAGVDRVASQQGQWFPVDPPGTNEATLGGVLATASAGALSRAYGRPRDLVLGLRVVTGDGRVLRFGGRVVKNVAGFDMVKLAVGSWGTLGVITEACIRLFPRPASQTFVVARADRLEDLVDAAKRVAGSASIPSAVELFERPAAPDTRTEREAMLVARLDGPRERVAHEAALIGKLLDPLPFELLQSAEGLQGDLRSLEAGSELALCLTLPSAALGDLVSAIRLAAPAPHEFGPGVVVDALRGCARVALAAPESSGASPSDRVRRLSALRGRLETEGGGLTVSHGPDAFVRALGAWGGAECQSLPTSWPRPWSGSR